MRRDDPDPSLPEQRPDRLAERRAGGVDLGLGLVRRDLEPKLEASGSRELEQQVVQDRDTGGHARLAVTERDPGRGLATHSSARSTAAPMPRSRSSIRS